MPVSTTHVISSAILGAGARNASRACDGASPATILMAWVLTLPAAGLTAALAWIVLNPILG